MKKNNVNKIVISSYLFFLFLLFSRIPSFAWDLKCDYVAPDSPQCRSDVPYPTVCPAPAGWCDCGNKYCGTPSLTCGGVLTKWWVHCWTNCCSVTNDPPYNPPGNRPYGSHDASYCDNDGNIISTGWACDADDYDTPLDIHIYSGKAGSGGTFIASGTANITRTEPPDPWPVCDGKRDHGFWIKTSSTFPAGTYQIYAYGLDIGSPAGPVIANSPKTVVCNPTVNKVRLDGIIWKGDRLDNPATPGNTYKGNNTLTCTNNYHTGFKVTSNKTGATNLATNWWCHHSNNNAYYNTPYVIPENAQGVTLTLSGLPANHIVDRWIYRTSSGTENKSGVFTSAASSYTTGPLNISPSDTWRNLNWRLVDCSNVSWVEVSDCSTMCGPGVHKLECMFPDSRCPGTPNCFSIPKPTPSSCNMDNPCKYNLKTTVKKIPSGVVVKDNCSTLMSGASALEGALVTASSKNDPSQPKPLMFSGSAPSDSQGISLINNIPYGVTRLLIGGHLRTNDEDTPDTYTMVCPSSMQYTFPTPPDQLPYPEGGSIPAGGNYPTAETSIGLQAIYKAGWLSVIDADIFSHGLDVPIPLGRTDNSNSSQTPQGFAKVLLNTIHPNPSLNDELMLGYAFVEDSTVYNPNINEPIPNTKLSEVSSGSTEKYQYGGIAYNLRAKGYDHKSKWLENFTFKAPASAKDINTLPLNLEGATVYKVRDGSLIIGSSGYNYTVQNENKGPVIVYVNGNLSIQGPVTTNSNQRLLFVVNGAVDISSNVGTLVSSFNMSQDPNIMAGIIARDTITINKDPDRDISAGRFDIPIMLSAPLVSKTGILFQRDLGHQNNATMPGQSVKQYNKFLYEITKLEREKGIDDLYFTGVTTFDLDWEYIY